LIVVQHTPIREEERLSELETSRGTLLAIIGCFQGCSLDLSLVHTPDDLPEEDLTTRNSKYDWMTRNLMIKY
jgi:hypothetical protein